MRSSDAAAAGRGRSIRATSRKRHRARGRAPGLTLIYQPGCLTGDSLELPDPVLHVRREHRAVHELHPPHRNGTVPEPDPFLAPHLGEIAQLDRLTLGR